MKGFSISRRALIVLALVCVAAGEDKKASMLIQSANTRLNVVGDRDGAVALCEQAVSEATTKAVKAKALVMLGIALRHKDDRKADSIFHQVILEFGDQKESALKAQQWIALMDQSRPVKAGAESYGPLPVEPIWHEFKTNTEGRISFDGRYLTFVDRSTEPSVSVRNLVTGMNITLPNPKGDIASPVLSRDNKEIAYGWRSPSSEGYELRVIGRDGSLDRMLYSAPDVVYLEPRDWTSDGKILTVLWKKNGVVQISLVSSYRQTKPVMTFINSQAPDNVSISADGKFIAYDDVQHENGSSSRGITVINIDGTKRGDVSNAANDFVLGWAPPDAKRLLFAREWNGQTGIWSAQMLNGEMIDSPMLVRANIGAVYSMGMTSTGSLVYGVGSKPPIDPQQPRRPAIAAPAGSTEVRKMNNLLSELTRLEIAAQSGKPQTVSMGSIEGTVVQLGTNSPVAGADVELTRLEGTSSAPLAPGSKEAFTTLFADGHGNPGGATPPPALAPEVQYGKTNDKGEFSFQNLKPGGYRLVTLKIGESLFPSEYGQRNPNGRGLIFPLSESQSMKNVKLEMAPTRVITGRVVDEDGEPMGHVNVQAVKVIYINGKPNYRAQDYGLTDNNGDFRLFWLPPGSYFVAANVPDAANVNSGGIRPGRTSAFELMGGPATLKYISSTGETIEETYGVAYYGGGFDPEHARLIDLQTNASFSGADIMLGQAKVRSYHIRGTLTNGTTGRPVSGAQIRAVPTAQSSLLTVPFAATDADGRFDIAGVVPGNYGIYSQNLAAPASGQNLAALATGQSPVVGSPIPVVQLMGYASIEVGSEDVFDLKIVAIPLPKVTGTLRTEKSSSEVKDPDVSKIRIALVNDPPSIALPNPTGSRPVAADGTFGLEFSPAPHRIQFTGIPPNMYVKSARIGSRDLLVNGLQLINPATEPMEIVLAGDTGDLDGLAIDKNLKPMANVIVVLVPDALELRQRADFYKSIATDASGHFHFQAIPQGEYKLFAWEFAEPDIWQNAAFLKPFEALGKQIQIDEGKKQEVQITVIPTQR